MASSTVAHQEMDANHKARRNNSSLAHQENKNMEEVAATKIQASFRGYQVRKQLKTKNGGTEAISQGRVGRRKNSGKLRSSDVSAVSKNTSAKKNSDIEERSATKIQAGVRGFLVRRRFKKDKTNTPESS
ncbi:uncharacterized protein LOC112903956 [Agrilus planipennis]|uniref:Uncharacterized protein LOC112903956 n=1 Tax=Agrilus planipennis TaxID=224129 RepID=A0A7F5RCQ3_AGRPL|nr:uncharacterized protein LOC112903956 [Agrilus planipennis]